MEPTSTITLTTAGLFEKELALFVSFVSYQTEN